MAKSISSSHVSVPNIEPPQGFNQVEICLCVNRFAWRFPDCFRTNFTLGAQLVASGALSKIWNFAIL
jgi:hypothetical protein